MRGLERAVIALEHLPWSILYRAPVGYSIVPLYQWWAGKEPALWKIWLIFIGVLIALRIGPAVLRRGLPFSGDAKTIWAQRREWAKSYDSYQWQKLLGIGIGWVAGVAFYGAPRGAMALAIACTVAGAAGMTFWERRKRLIPKPVAAAA